MLCPLCNVPMQCDHIVSCAKCALKRKICKT